MTIGILLFGPSAAGKGTFARSMLENSAHQYGVLIEAGGLARANVDKLTPKEQSDLQNRVLLPPSTMANLVLTELLQKLESQPSFVVLDGFPRDLKQKVLFNVQIRTYCNKWFGVVIDKTLKVCKEQSKTRRGGEIRSDDSEEKIEKGYKRWLEIEKPVITQLASEGIKFMVSRKIERSKQEVLRALRHCGIHENNEPELSVSGRAGSHTPDFMRPQ